MRLFVAIELPSTIRARVGRYAADARAALGDALRWEPYDNLHVTVCFLGEVPEERLPLVTATLDARAATSAPLGLALAPPGRFTGAAWVGVADRTGALAPLATDLARDLGVTAGRPYHPHVTIGRFRDPRRSRRLILPEADLDEPFEVADLVLYASEAQPTGPPRYVVVHRAHVRDHDGAGA